MDLAQNRTGNANRGPGRPFEKGNRANPGGRKKGVTALAQKYCRDGRDVFEMLSAIVKNTSAKDSDRIAAGKELLDRAFGKATQPTGEISDEQFCEMARGIARAKGYDEQAFVDRSLENRRLARAQGYGR